MAEIAVAISKSLYYTVPKKEKKTENISPAAKRFWIKSLFCYIFNQYSYTLYVIHINLHIKYNMKSVRQTQYYNRAARHGYIKAIAPSEP